MTDVFRRRKDRWNFHFDNVVAVLFAYAVGWTTWAVVNVWLGIVIYVVSFYFFTREIVNPGRRLRSWLNTIL